MAFGHISADDNKDPGNSACLFGLPGNPVAVMVTFYFFARQALLRMMGAVSAAPIYTRVASASAIRKKPGRTEYQRGIVSVDEQGRQSVRITGSQGSGILSSMSEANCMVVLHHAQSDVQSGEVVDVLLFDALV
jgi:molybdopterin molybdotransferase